MSRPEELTQNDAIEPEGSAGADGVTQVPESLTGAAQDSESQRSSAARQQNAILEAAFYWGLDPGSLPNNEA